MYHLYWANLIINYNQSKIIINASVIFAMCTIFTVGVLRVLRKVYHFLKTYFYNLRFIWNRQCVYCISRYIKVYTKNVFYFKINTILRLLCEAENLSTASFRCFLNFFFDWKYCNSYQFELVIMFLKCRVLIYWRRYKIFFQLRCWTEPEDGYNYCNNTQYKYN